MSQAYPFPLPADSSHHSNYHSFLLGAPESLLAPMPKPRCTGELVQSLPCLAGELTLAGWRKLYHASFPWVDGFGAAHYAVGNVAPHRPLPADYRRPARRFAAYDFVQIADPGVSALALVAGDARVLDRFFEINRSVCEGIERGAATQLRRSDGARATGRCLIGLFAEPNDRWLMPLLHVHSRVLNFTAFKDDPRRLQCIDADTLRRAGRVAKKNWLERQADGLKDLGYRIDTVCDDGQRLRIAGVSGRLTEALEAPRIAVMRLVEKMLGEMPEAGLLGSVAHRLERVLAQSYEFHRPRKVGIPCEGPWRQSVRAHLADLCPRELSELTDAAAKARAVPADWNIFPSQAADEGHRHGTDIESFGCPEQQPQDSDLIAECSASVHPIPRSWLIHQYEQILCDVRRAIQAGSGEYSAHRRRLSEIEFQGDEIDTDCLRSAERALACGIEAQAHKFSAEPEPPARVPKSRVLVSLDELFDSACAQQSPCVREIGGRSL